MLCHLLIFNEFHSKTSDYYTCIITFLYIYYNKKSIAVLFLRLSLRCMVLWVTCVLIALILQYNILCLYIPVQLCTTTKIIIPLPFF